MKRDRCRTLLSRRVLPKMAPGTFRPSRRGGQVYVEYIVILVMTVAAIIGLTAPLGSNPSALDQLVEAFKLFWAHYTYLISLP